MPTTEKEFTVFLDETLDETLDLTKRDRARFTNALLERLREEDAFTEDEEDCDETPENDEEDV